MSDKSNKVCIVTGASSGIGLATAMRFASEGYSVAICGRNRESLDAAIEKLGNLAPVETICGDVGAESTRQQLISTALEKFGRLDVLVNNAGLAPLNEFASIDDETFENVLDVNVRAVFSMTQKAWRAMSQSGGGAIINISSMAAVDPFPGFSIYGASKAWMELFTKAIAAEGTDHSIRACCVRPGAVETGLLRGLFPDFPAEQCVGPEEIANKVWACVHEPDSHPTGESFTVSK